MPWLLSQRWDDILFAHWPTGGDAVRRVLPSGVEPDLRDGRAWIGIVAFRMTETRAAGLVPPRGLGPIPELNVRTYVRAAGQPGVWFLSLDTSSPLFVTVGRAIYGLAYHRARMVIARSGARVHYASARGPGSTGRASLAAGAAPTSPVRPRTRLAWACHTRGTCRRRLGGTRRVGTSRARSRARRTRGSTCFGRRRRRRSRCTRGGC